MGTGTSTNQLEQTHSKDGPVEIRFYQHALPIRVAGDVVVCTPNQSSISAFILRTGLTGVLGTVSFESLDKPGYFLRHSKSVCWLHPFDNEDGYKKDTSFLVIRDPAYPKYVRFRCVNLENYSLAYADNDRLVIEEYNVRRIEDFLWEEGPQGIALGAHFKGMAYKSGASWEVTDDIIHATKENMTLFYVRPGLSKTANSVSFELAEKPGHYIRHASSVCWLHSYEDGQLYRQDASFIPIRDTRYPGSVRYQPINNPSQSLALYKNGRLAIVRYNDATPGVYLWKDVPHDSAPPLEIKSYANQRPMRAVADEILDKSNTSPSLFILRPGLSGIKDSFSFEDAFKPGKFVRHSCAVCCLRTFLADDENDATFKYDASFARISYTAYRGCVRYQSVNYPDHSLAYLANGRLAIEPYDPIRVEDYLWIESSKDEGAGIEIKSYKEERPWTLKGDQIQAKLDFTLFYVRPSIASLPDAISIESMDKPGFYIRHANDICWLHPFENDELYKSEASFLAIRDAKLRTVRFRCANLEPSDYCLTFRPDGHLAVEKYNSKVPDKYLWTS